jgi:type IV secretion system protein TrbF
MSFFSKKTESKAEHDTGTPGLSPYVAAQLKWDERYGDWIIRAKNWRIAAGMFAVIAIINGIGWYGADARATHVRPYIAVLDKQGRQVASGFADGAPVATDQLTRISLGEWLGYLRMVSTDPQVQIDAWNHVKARLSDRSAADVFVREFYRTNPPGNRAERGTVSVQVRDVVPVSDHTYQADWTETTRDLSGSVKLTEEWRGFLGIGVDPPKDEAAARANPLGVYVTNLSWTRVL